MTPSQLAAIEHARRVAPGENDSLSDPRYQLARAIRHQRYVMELFGLTKAMLGVTAHGLRHGYAAERYEAEAGVAPPVATNERAVLSVPDDPETQRAVEEVRAVLDRAYALWFTGRYAEAREGAQAALERAGQGPECGNLGVLDPRTALVSQVEKGPKLDIDIVARMPAHQVH